MSTETLEIRQLARQFAESELRPHVEQWDHEGAISESVLAQVAELGFPGMLVPETFGGMGFDLPTWVAALEELAWGEPAVALRIALDGAAADLVARHGSDAQQRSWLEALARGDGACFVRADGDVHAAARGDEWTLSGTRPWVANGRAAHLAIVLARTPSAAAAFLVPTATPGYVVAGRQRTLGLRPLEIVGVELRELAVAAQDRIELPAEEAAHSVAGLLGIAAISVGIAQAALEHAQGYADVREQFGTRLREFEGVQFKLADMATRTAAARTLLHDAAGRADAGSAAMAKVLASETAMWVATQAVQIYGGYGYMRDYPVEKLMRDAKAMALLEASNEDLRVLIARSLYR